MKIVQHNSTIETNVKQRDFSIELNAVAFKVLATDLYSDPVSSVIREIISNAVDACNAGSLPIMYDVHLPTKLDQTFKVRDYGVSLNEQEVFGMYSTLFASSKRDSDTAIGALGIGKLSPLSLAGSFSVTSFLDGVKTMYVVTMDNGIPATSKLGSVPTEEANGVEISVAVSDNFLGDFKRKLEKFLRFFPHQPKHVNTTIDVPKDVITMSGTGWAYYKAEYGASPLLVMGGVAYPFSTSGQLSSWTVINAGTIIYAELSDAIEFTPSREGLVMSQRTIDFISSKVAAIKSEFIAQAKKGIDACTTSLDKHVKYRDIAGIAPYALSLLLKDAVELPHIDMPYGSLKRYSANCRNGTSNNSLTYTENVSYVLQDISAGFVQVCKELVTNNPKRSVVLINCEDLPAVEKRLRDFGFTSIYYASKLYVKPVRTSVGSGKAISDFYVYNHSRYGVRRYDLFSKISDGYTYFLTEGNKLVNESDKDVIEYIKRNQQNAQIIGIPKSKINSVIQVHKNIKHIDTHVQQMLDQRLYLTEQQRAVLNSRLYTADYDNFVPQSQTAREILAVSNKYTGVKTLPDEVIRRQKVNVVQEHIRSVEDIAKEFHIPRSLHWENLIPVDRLLYLEEKERGWHKRMPTYKDAKLNVA